jgi:nucleotide-binding universal stress UspA family protein
MEARPARGRIVVGVDGSDSARQALAWARDEAVLRGAGLRVVHAWSPPPPVTEIGVMVSPGDDETYEKLAQEVLSDACATIAADSPASLTIESSAVRGYPSSVLLHAATEADLLVVGSRGRGGFAELLLGSVSHQCVHHADGPVAVIPPSAPAPGSGDVVVGVDGSEGSWMALRWAVDEAAIRGARLSVVHAWTTAYAVPPGGQRLLHEMVDGTVARAERPPPDIELLPVEEPPAPALLHRAKGAGLLVVGGRGRGGFAALLLGSVSQQCLHHASCAVVVVPHRG